MWKYLTIKEAQQQLPKWPEDLASEPAIITKDGKPAIIALSFKQFESLLETIEIVSDSEFMTQLRCGIQQAQRGEKIDLQQLKVDLKLWQHGKMDPVEYQVILTAQARQIFAEMKARWEQQLLLGRLDKLKHEPEKQGKALSE